MYTSFSIENFRLFDKLRVEPLARVNLIAGQNNSGKTALLEAIWMLNHPATPRQALRISGWRDSVDYSRGSFYADLFYRFDPDLTICLQGAEKQISDPKVLKIKRQYRAQQPLFDLSAGPGSDPEDDDASEFDFENELIFDYYQGDNVSSCTSAWLDSESGSGRSRPMLREGGRSPASRSYRCVFENSRGRWNTRILAANLGKAEIEGALTLIEDVIRLLEPRLKRLTTVADARGVPSIYADIGAGRLYPISIMGDGTKRILALCLSLLRARHGVLLVDEIENGLHNGALIGVWQNLGRLAHDFDVQVFATTHSYECIVAANAAFSDLGSDDLHLHRLYRRSPSEPVKAMTYTKEALDTNIEYLWELR
jgi:hypothetical protein